MALSDFLVYSSSAKFSLDYGSAREHSLLSNPYLSGGLYYRSFENSNNSPTISFVPVTGALTSSTGYAYGKSYSIRALVRIQNTSDTTGICLAFKTDEKLGITGSTGNDYQELFGQNASQCNGSGYRLYVFNESITLRCSLLQNTTTAGGALNVTVSTSASNGFPLRDRWNKVRMDIIPVTGAYDIIKIYSGSLSSDSWSLISTQNISSQSSARYVPWNFGSEPNTKGYLGFLAHSDTLNDGTAAIDDFQVFTEDI
jgi:hypothetical protein